MSFNFFILFWGLDKKNRITFFEPFNNPILVKMSSIFVYLYKTDQNEMYILSHGKCSLLTISRHVDGSDGWLDPSSSEYTTQRLGRLTGRCSQSQVARRAGPAGGPAACVVKRFFM